MVQSAFSAPHVSVFVDVDATRSMEYVKRLKTSPDFAVRIAQVPRVDWGRGGKRMVVVNLLEEQMPPA